MGSRHDFHPLFGGLVSGLLLVLALPAMGDTTFTYQGQLQDDDGAYSGSVDLHFELYDDETGGSAVGSPISLDGHPVEEGLFQAELDFGDEFSDGPRWLEITVDGETLSPRQAVTAAPLAIHALSGSDGGAGSNWSTSGDDIFYNDGGVAIGVISPGDHSLQVIGAAAFGDQSSQATGDNAFSSGFNNEASANQSFVTGGGNTASGLNSFVGGGGVVTASADRSAAIGGSDNTAAGDRSVVVGGNDNDALGGNSVVVGGHSHESDGAHGVIVAGHSNEISSNVAATLGGTHNSVTGLRAVAIGGIESTAGGTNSAVIGAEDGQATGDGSFIAGSGTYGDSDGHRATEWNSAVVGGSANTASALDAGVMVGFQNTADEMNAFIGGGFDNVAGGANSFIAGGAENKTGGLNTFAAGEQARAVHDNSFVWSDGSAEEGLETTADGQFVVSAAGAVQFISGETRDTGVELAPGGSGWQSISDRDAKKAIEAVEPVEVLDRVMELPVSEFSYKSQDTDTRHMGPMAQDFHSLFDLGEDELRISPMNLAGISLAAVQGLNEELQARDDEISALRAELEEMRQALEDERAETADRLAALEALLLEGSEVASKAR